MVEKRIEEAIKQKFGCDVEVTRRVVKKNNNREKVGYEVKKVSSRICPVFYIEDDMSDDDIVDYIVESYGDEPEAEVDEINVKDCFAPDYLYDNVIPCLISQDNNRDYVLENNIYTEEFLDMYVVYKVITSINNCEGVITLTNSIIEEFDIDASKLRDAGLKLVEKKSRLSTLAGIVCELTDDKIESTEDIYVSGFGTRGTYGASTILSDKVIADLHKVLKTDKIFIIPSSIHEVLVGDANTEDFDVQPIKIMISEVNDEVCSAEDVLSYNLYYHDKEAGFGIFE